MGVSIYVMPLETWLGGNFRTTWDIRGIQPAPERPKRSVEEVRRLIDLFREDVQRHLGFVPEWDQDGEIVSAVSMSYPGFARPALAAQRYASEFRAELLRQLEPPVILLPSRFEGLVELSGEMRVGSAAKWQEELEGVQSRLEQDPLMAELAGLPEGSTIAGALYEFWDDVGTTRRLKALAALGVERHLPVIVEG